MTEIYIRSLAAQIIGRVFTCDGDIHFVLGTDTQTGMARCSRRTTDGPAITYLPMEEVRTILIEQAGGPVEETAEETPTLQKAC